MDLILPETGTYQLSWEVMREGVGAAVSDRGNQELEIHGPGVYRPKLDPEKLQQALDKLR